MNPSFTVLDENEDILRFNISGVDKCFVNAIRRTILSDINTVCIDTSDCEIKINHSRYHNEIIKERLKCIPVHIKDLEKFYIMICFIKNLIKIRV
jgi:DNA-directed RNA polymerase alpha subunit